MNALIGSSPLFKVYLVSFLLTIRGWELFSDLQLSVIPTFTAVAQFIKLIYFNLSAVGDQ